MHQAAEGRGALGTQAEGRGLRPCGGRGGPHAAAGGVSMGNSGQVGRGGAKPLPGRRLRHRGSREGAARSSRGRSIHRRLRGRSGGRTASFRGFSVFRTSSESAPQEPLGERAQNFGPVATRREPKADRGAWRSRARGRHPRALAGGPRVPAWAPRRRCAVGTRVRRAQGGRWPADVGGRSAGPGPLAQPGHRGGVRSPAAPHGAPRAGPHFPRFGFCVCLPETV